MRFSICLYPADEVKSPSMSAAEIHRQRRYSPCIGMVPQPCPGPAPECDRNIVLGYTDSFRLTAEAHQKVATARPGMALNGATALVKICRWGRLSEWQF